MFWHRLKKVKSLVQPLTKQALKSQQYIVAQVYVNWKSIVGEHLSTITDPEKIQFSKKDSPDPGVLYLKVRHSGYVMELRFYEKMIVEKVNGFLGYKAVGVVKYVHILNKKESPLVDLKKNFSKELSISLSDHHKNLMEGIDDISLKEALINLGKGILNQKK